MHASLSSWWPLLLAATVAGTAGAQTPPEPMPVYRSAFDGYRAFDDPPASSWKASNDTVGRIGGWRTYAREASGDRPPVGQPSPAASATTPAPAATPGAMNPVGHGHHGDQH